MVDSGAAHSACPSDYATMNMKFAKFSARSNSRRPVVNSLNIMVRNSSRAWPQDSVMGITYQVTDVEGPVAAVSSMNDGGMTVVFSPQGAWVCDETPLKPAGSIELKLENRTFWMDLPRADSEQVQRMMALRREQPVEQVEQIAGNPAIEEKRQGIVASANPVVQDNEDTPVARARKPPPGPTAEELDKHELTHVVFRSWCKHCISSRAKEDPHRSVATHEGRTPKVMLDWMFFTSDQEPGVQLPVLVVYDLSTGAVMAMQSTKDSSVVTVGAVVQTLETWGHTDVVLHADGEPATKSLVRSVANARVHRTLPRHGPPHSHQSQGPVEACIPGLPWNLCGKQVGIGSRNRLSSAVETSCSCMVDQARCLADYQIQHWKRWMLSFQEDLWKALQRQHLQIRRAGTLQAEWTSLESC